MRRPHPRLRRRVNSRMSSLSRHPSRYGRTATAAQRRDRRRGTVAALLCGKLGHKVRRRPLGRQRTRRSARCGGAGPVSRSGRY